MIALRKHFTQPNIDGLAKLLTKIGLYMEFDKPVTAELRAQAEFYAQCIFQVEKDD